MGEEKSEMIEVEGGCNSTTSRLMRLRQMKPLPNTCRGQLHLTSAGTPAPSEERHVDDKGGRLGRRSRLEFEPLRRGLRNRSLPLVPAITTNNSDREMAPFII